MNNDKNNNCKRNLASKFQYFGKFSKVSKKNHCVMTQLLARYCFRSVVQRCVCSLDRIFKRMFVFQECCGVAGFVPWIEYLNACLCFRSAVERCVCSLDWLLDSMESTAHILDRMQTTRLPVLLFPSLFLFSTGGYVSREIFCFIFSFEIKICLHCLKQLNGQQAYWL